MGDAERLARFIVGRMEAQAELYGGMMDPWEELDEDYRNFMIAVSHDALVFLGLKAGPVVVPEGQSLDKVITERERESGIVTVGGHSYPGLTASIREGASAFYASECEHGCGARMDAYDAWAPEGIDPFGDCPEHEVKDV